ncbi:Acg family FMN-binding oxidoreductase [Petropleomorpha daqingensis]|uniref:Nitroreductase n=1 Tax=Petropleomorpha daqingensis TaxID=2026353 RepID=A0A853CL28_9ACTN|nr:nitroreductase [Petropleomorpha daqingensis]NYJ08774.1 nitroreductase [Petropleomorpha daqingensis]
MRAPTPHPHPIGSPEAWREALEVAADHGRLAPSVHNTQPWVFALFPDRLEVRADRSRQLAVLDPEGRELVMSVGAALFGVRASLAASRLAPEVRRLPDPDDPDLLATVEQGSGAPDPALAPLDRVTARRHTNRHPFGPETVPAEDLEELAAAVAAEDAVLVPVRAAQQRVLVGELTRLADLLQNADPDYRDELRRWTGQSPAQGDGVPASSVPRTAGPRTDAVPVRDFDLRGTGGLPKQTGSGVDQTLLLLATAQDDVLAWLRAGEALQRLLLELTRRDWVAGPLTQSLEVPETRARLGELTDPFVPQMLLRVGRAAPAEPTARRPRRAVVENSSHPDAPAVPRQPAPAPAPTPAVVRPAPVPDGRGGTTWG